MSDGSDLTHVTDDGDAQMVDVGDKPDTARRAVARGRIDLDPSTIESIRRNGTEKGDVLAVARVGAIDAVKHTWGDDSPMSSRVFRSRTSSTGFSLDEDGIELTVAVETTGKTGCEMEAIQGVTTGLGVVWDMVKAAEKDEDGEYPGTAITDVEVVSKEKRELSE